MKLGSMIDLKLLFRVIFVVVVGYVLAFGIYRQYSNYVAFSQNVQSNILKQRYELFKANYRAVKDRPQVATNNLLGRAQHFSFASALLLLEEANRLSKIQGSADFKKEETVAHLNWLRTALEQERSDFAKFFSSQSAKKKFFVGKNRRSFLYYRRAITNSFNKVCSLLNKERELKKFKFARSKPKE